MSGVTIVKSAKTINKEATVAALRKAILVERKARYADFQGRRSTFSRFMRQTAETLARSYPYEANWFTLRGLFREYPNMDVGTRISIVKRAEELLFDGASSTPKTGYVQEANNGYKAIEESGSTDGQVRPGALHAPEGRTGRPRPQGERQWTDQRAPADPYVPAGSPRSQVSASTDPSAPADSHVPAGSPRSQRSSASPDPKHTTDSKLPADPKHNDDQDKRDPRSTPVQYVKGVGPKLAAVLAQMNIATVEDLLRHYPRRHLDYQNRLKIKELQAGQEVTIIGTIRSVSAFQARNRNISILTIVINDGTGSVNIVRFIGGKSNKYLLDRYKEQFPKGYEVMASGIVEYDRFGKKFSLKNAEVELLGFGLEGGAEEHESEANAFQSVHAGRIVPVYPLTEGLSLRHFRSVIYNALHAYGQNLVDPLPDIVKQKLDLLDLKSGITGIHFPENLDEMEAARRRLVFDELFSVQLTLAMRRHKFDQTESALCLPLTEGGLVDRLQKSLPFKLTGAQERVFREITKDLAAAKPMHRLVQGDVGSGKTIVALMAALVAVDNGYQVVVMAPTEILAEQHARQFQRLVTPLGLSSTLVLGKHGKKERREIRQQILSGQIHIVVGTHALLEEDVEFKNLGLIVIDEQHRFGVKQRARLKAKSLSPELLTMTATPIPRTLALTMHGDLDVSEIDELPPGRKPVTTKLLSGSQKKELWEFISQQVSVGRQIYIVFPLIEESESLAAKAATQEYERLKASIFPDLRIGLMHGKLKPQEKDQVMDEFRANNYDILVCTTVIEVGVDVPNASVMVIENADRFGLSQLHQLRGRVGRSSEQSYCFLVTENRSPTTRQRLEIMTQTNDGFVVAEKDLEIRGPGEFLGYKQSGLPDLVLTDLVKDVKILEEARQIAIELVKSDPQLDSYPLLKALQNTKSEIGEILHSG